MFINTKNYLLTNYYVSLNSDFQDLCLETPATPTIGCRIKLTTNWQSQLFVV